MGKTICLIRDIMNNQNKNGKFVDEWITLDTLGVMQLNLLSKEIIFTLQVIG